MCNNHVCVFLLVYLNFSKPLYKQYEDIGALCIALTLDKPAPFDMTVEINEITGSATG